MKTSFFISLWLLVATAPHLLAINPQHNLSSSRLGSTYSTLLSRNDWHRLSSVGKKMEYLLHKAQTVGTRVWPHAVRDASGRAGLIIMAQRPLLMSMNTEDLDARQTWILVAVLSAAKESSETTLPLDHLALTDTDGAQGQLWYFDVDIRLARQLYQQLKEHKITLGSAYREIVRSWRLVTGSNEVACR